MEFNIVLNGFYKPPSLLRQVDRLRSEAEKYGRCDVVDTAELLAHIDASGSVSCDINADAVIYLDKDTHVAAMLEKCGLKLFNSARSIAVTDDKMATHIALSNIGIDMPVTVSAPLMYRGEDDGAFIDKLLTVLHFPIIVKECHGSFGSQVYIAGNVDELTELRARLKNKPHIYQQFIESSVGRDVRLIVIGNRVIAAMERRNEENFKSNIEQGGRGYAIDIASLNTAFIETAVKAVASLGLDYAGVDLLYGSDGEPILCEINSNAYFNTISEVTGIDVPSVYIAHIVNKAEHGLTH